MWDYSDKVKDYFFNPRNAKEVKDANATGDVGSITCGDALRLQLRVNPETEVIEDAGFQTFGCGSAIASSSALTEMIIGKTLDEAAKVTNKDIADYLDGLPPEKMHCSVMGREALDAAIANYRGITPEENHIESPLICKCFGIDEAKIVREVTENNLSTLQDVINYTKAGGACGSCHEKIEKILDGIKKGEYAGKYVTTDMEAVRKAAEEKSCSHDHAREMGAAGGAHPPKEASAADDAPARPFFMRPEPKKPDAGRKNATGPNPDHLLWKPISDLFDEIRPGLNGDGGDIELVHVDFTRIDVRLTGQCQGCMMEDMTLSFIADLIEERLGLKTVINNLNNPMSGEFDHE
ncbi:MAG: Fe-S cluster assembly protein NifU [Succinivibrionaceae bacterium]|nr:Fe-S cluster assembly protein NifU [Succinivibrionaceae bacterium]